jgi:hypothetical protein
MRSSMAGQRGCRMRRRARLFGATALMTCAGLATQAGAAQAQQDVTFTFDEVRMNLGDNKGVGLVDPAVGDPPALLVGEVDPLTKEFSAQADGFLFPPKLLDNVESGNALIPIIDATFSPTATEPITGTFDQQTGELAIASMNTTVSVFVAAGPGGVLPEGTHLATCDSSPVPLPLQTQGEIVDDDGDPVDPVTFAAAPFAPPSGEGAAVTTWDSLPVTVATSSTGLEGLVCPGVDALVTGPGGAWFSGASALGTPPDGDGDGVPDIQDQCLDQPGPALTDGCPDADNDGVRDSEDQCPNQSGPAVNDGCPLPSQASQPSQPPRGAEGSGPARLEVAVTPKREKTKPGKRARFGAELTNTGGTAADGIQVCVAASKRKGIRGLGCRTVGSLAANASVRQAFAFKVKRRAKGKRLMTFTATASGVDPAGDAATLRIKRKKNKG